MSDRHRHPRDTRPRPVPRYRTPEPPLVAGGQGRDAASVTHDASAWGAAIVLACGVLTLVVLLPKVVALVEWMRT